MAEQTSSNIVREIAKVLEKLKGAFSSDEAVRYVIALCFLRWMTDLKHRASSGDCFAVAQRGSGETLVLNLPDDLELQMILLTSDVNNLGDKLNRVFSQLEFLNNTELDSVFEGIDFTNRRFKSEGDKYGILYEVLCDIANIEIATTNDVPNLIGLTVQVASEALVAGLYAPEFNTPLSVCKIVARLINPVQGESIYDPVCGSGQLLTVCAENVTDGSLSCIAANELNFSSWALAKLNLIAHGISSKHVLQINALEPEGVHVSNEKQATFDIVVGHPPWSARYNNYERLAFDKYNRFQFGLPPRNNADYAFILHMVSSMKSTSGRAAVVISNGALTRTGAERDIRRTLIDENLIDAVIGLPEKMFQGTPIPGAILLLKSNRTSSDLLFVDSRSLASIGRGRSTLPPESIDKIADLYQERTSSLGISARVSQEAVRNNDYSLSIPLYVSSVIEENTRPLESIQAEIRSTEQLLQELSLRITYIVEELDV